LMEEGGLETTEAGPYSSQIAEVPRVMEMQDVRDVLCRVLLGSDLEMRHLRMMACTCHGLR
jgi:hypothetical protein